MSPSVKFPQERLATVADREPPITGTSSFSLALNDVEPWTGKLHLKSPSDEIQQGNLFTPGTILFGKLRPYLAKIWVSDRTGVYIGDFISVRPRSETDPNFLSYVFRTEDFIHRATAESYGSKMPRIEWDRFKNLKVPIPRYSTQRMIADFLDHETAEIDAFIDDQQRLIKLLEERRDATITRVVTKGLEPDASMKDSGVKWLGEVPRHWGIRKLKSFVATPITDGPHETPELVSEGVPFVSAEAVSSGVLDFKNIRGYISLEDHRRFSRKYSPQRGDIYMIKSGATTGRCALVDTDADFSIWSPLAVIRCDDTASPRFVLHALRSANFQESVRLFWNYGTQQNIGMKVLENLPIPFPDIAEQHELAAYLDGEVAELDAAVSDAREAIALSRERRAALISAAVTGQLDVSQAQRPVDEVLKQGVRV